MFWATVIPLPRIPKSKLASSSSLLVTMTVASFVPVVVGSNVTSKVDVPLGESVVAVVPEIVKSAAFVPEIATLEISRSALPVLVIVKVEVADPPTTSTEPKSVPMVVFAELPSTIATELPVISISGNAATDTLPVTLN